MIFSAQVQKLMKSKLFAFCFLALALNQAPAAPHDATKAIKAAPAASAAVDTNAPAVVPANPYPLHIVTLREDADVVMDDVLREHQLKLKKPKHKLQKLKMFFAELDDKAIKKLKADPRVVAVEADGPVSLGAQGKPHGIVRMGIPQFPPARLNGRTEPIDVDVAILDSGIDPHEDLNIYDNFSMFDETGYDVKGHGTAVAGVLAALDNGIGVVGVAPGVRIWNVKCHGWPPDNSWANLLGGMDYVAQNADKISVVNISLSNETANAPISSINVATRTLVRNGVVVVVAAGNSGWDLAGPDQVFGTGDDALPASAPYAMAVSAMDASRHTQSGLPVDQIWEHSNYSQVPRDSSHSTGQFGTNYVSSPGGAIDVAAPGTNIVTTAGDGTGMNYVLVTGTSFAAPHVAGLVALYIAANGRAPTVPPGVNPATNVASVEGVFRIRQAIIDNALPQSQWHSTNTLDPDTNPEPLAIASEAWIPKPVITNTAGAPGSFQVGFATVPGYDYTLQSTTNLAAPTVWTNLATIAGGSNVAPASVTDSNVASQSFYRLARTASVEPPSILGQPHSWATVTGATATLIVTAVGTTTLGYQWHKDGSPMANGGNISGTATDSLVVTNLQPADAGAYTVVVTNAYGSATSTVVTVTILTNWTSAVVTGVLATATSELGPPYNRYASNTVNGTIGGAVWESAGSGLGSGEDFRPAITFDLGSVRSLEKTVVWNGPEPGPAVKRLTIEVSHDGIGFISLGEFTLTTLSPASEAVPLGGAVGRYVRFTIQENGANQLFPVYTSPPGFAELDEVQFHEYQGN